MSEPFVLPEVSGFLTMLEDKKGAHMADLSAPAAREMFELVAQLFEEPAVDGVRAVDGALPRADGSAIALRAYLPAGHDAAVPAPVIVYFHGGGWVVGSLDTHHGLCSALAAWTGLRVVSVDYRLAPEHPFPAGHDDCAAAARAIAAGLPWLEGPVAGIALAGDSAGGNLAIATALALGPGAVLAQWLLYPAVDCAPPHEGSFRQFGEGFLLDRKSMARFFADTFPDSQSAHHPLASPLRHPLPATLPPTLVHTAALDPLRDQGRELAAGLARAGVESHYLEAAGLLHGFATLRRAMPSGHAEAMRGAAMLAEMIRVRAS